MYTYKVLRVIYDGMVVCWCKNQLFSNRKTRNMSWKIHKNFANEQIHI